MNVKETKDEIHKFSLTEKRAADYLQDLQEVIVEKKYIPALKFDFQQQMKQSIYQPSLFSIFTRKKKKPSTQQYNLYIQWLHYNGQLDDYLERSVSYLYLRDLGKGLDSPETNKRIEQVVYRLKDRLIGNDQASQLFSFADLYRFAQKNQVELTMIWVFDKLKNVVSNIPEKMDKTHAQRKILKIMAGVLMHELEEVQEEEGQKKQKRIEKAIKLGFYYGLTYPFIDDLLDANILSEQEEKGYVTLIRKTLLLGEVPSLGNWVEENKELLIFIHKELSEAIDFIKRNQDVTSYRYFLEQSYLFFHAQEIDREKNLAHFYSNEDLYVPVILKSSASRSIVKSLIRAEKDEAFETYTFYYGIYNQLADDFADLFTDLEEGAVTPYTYYWKYKDSRPDLINPFEMYWAVIYYLIHVVYDSDGKTRDVILARAVNGLKRFKERVGKERYEEIIQFFTSDMGEWNHFVQKVVNKEENVEFFDKLLRDHMIESIRKEQDEREEFQKTVENVRERINAFISLEEEKDLLEEAANYSLQGSGKRLRPVISWYMGVKEYGLKESQLEPLLQSIEYLHTASLIFDDLPSQDDASFRRGRPTLHNKYNSSTAELTGLFLTQKAIEVQSKLSTVRHEKIVELINYTTKVTASMCKGQAMDLASKHKSLDVEELNRLCFYKTGLGFEASLLMPAILADVELEEREKLQNFAYHAGIAFQIKDDLLDVEGNIATLGKTPGKDYANHSSTFVTVLGRDRAKKEMWNHYCLALEEIEKIKTKTNFLKLLLEYIVNRER